MTVAPKSGFSCRLVDEITIKVLAESSAMQQAPYLVTPEEIDLIDQYLPSFSYRIRKALGHPFNGGEGRGERLVMQLQSEIVCKMSTIDSSLIHGRRDAGSVGSKLHHLQRFATLYRMLGLKAPEPIPREVIERGNLDEILINAKFKFAEFFNALPDWLTPVPEVVRKVDLSGSQRARFAYLEDILSVNDSVVGVVLYGSAAREEDPSKFNDYDNYLVVRDGSLQSWYPAIVGRHFANPADGKEVSFNLIEESRFPRMVRMHHDPHESLESCLVVYGSASFPVVSAAESIERGISHALVRTKVLKSSAIWASTNPSRVVGKPHLFDFLQKSPLFIVQAGMNYTGGLALRGKHEFLEVLRSVGGDVLPYDPDTRHLTLGVYLAVAASSKLLGHYFSGKQFGNGFISLPKKN